MCGTPVMETTTGSPSMASGRLPNTMQLVIPSSVLEMHSTLAIMAEWAGLIILQIVIPRPNGSSLRDELYLFTYDLLLSC